MAKINQRFKDLFEKSIDSMLSATKVNQNKTAISRNTLKFIFDEGSGIRAIRSTVVKSSRTTMRTTAALEAQPEKKELSSDEITVVKWLGLLKQLQFVPLHYIIPHHDVLPSESIRFFCLDNNWITALIDGVFSLSNTTKVDEAIHVDHINETHDDADSFSLQLRAMVKNDRKGATNKHITGFLLRSSIISVFPTLEVHGFTDMECKSELDIIRMEQIDTGVLLVLFNGEVESIIIHQPTETMHFGFEYGQQGVNLLKKHANIKEYTNNFGKINIKNLAAKLSCTTSADFAKEMITGTEVVKLMPERIK